MAQRANTTFAKRQKEQARQEKQKAKLERKQQRKQEKQISPADSEPASSEPGMAIVTPCEASPDAQGKPSEVIRNK